MYFNFARPGRSLASSALALCALLFPALASGQPPASGVRGLAPTPDRITQPIDDNVRLTLKGTLHPLAKAENDLGLVPAAMKLDRVQIMLRRSDAQEAALKQLIDKLHTPHSPQYHRWLTPDQFGQQFGPSDADVAKIEGWLQSRGFTVTGLTPGRQTLEFSGTAGQFRNAFRAPIHSYHIKGQTRYANAADPQIPVSLAPVFGGFVSLNNFPLKSQLKKLGSATYNPKTHVSKPSWTIGYSYGADYLLAPGDFAVQYDLNPLYAVSTPVRGDGQSIAVINDSNINLYLVNQFRALFNLPPNPPQVIIDGNDPGIDGINNPFGPNYDSLEAYVDVEWAGAVAPDATIDLVIAGDTQLNSGLGLAAERAVFSNLAPIISVSFLGCEQDQGTGNYFWSYLWEQAAAQGITVSVAAGDSGSAGCDGVQDYQYYAVHGAAVNGIASTPFNVAVGGTDFYYSQYAGGQDDLNAQIASYWNTTPSNNAPTISLVTPVPEQAWNDSQYGLNLYPIDANYDYDTISAGGGGPSTCAIGNVTNDYPVGYTSCTSGWSKPVWQTGTGVPNDSVRDLPDLSLYAADGYNNSYYPICSFDGDCQPVSGDSTVQVTGVGGTSVSAQVFAGVMALVNQKYGRQGQADYVLYPLAQQYPTAFHDVVTGTNSVPCNTTTVYDDSGNSYPPVDCLAVSNPFGVSDPQYGYTVVGQIGLSGAPVYNAGPGYDLATGLGSIDAANLVSNWSNVSFGASSTTLTPSSTSFTHGTAITISGSVTGSSPTGDVALLNSSSEYAEQGQTYFTLSGGDFSQSGINWLPGGTYQIWGRYAGDTNNAPSGSTPVSITVTPEASTTALQVSTSSGSLIAAGTSLPYGSTFISTATPAPAVTPVGGLYTPPTGTIAFSDGSTLLNTASINDDGLGTYNYAFPPGPHSVTATYSGDNSYQASTSSPIPFTITKATPYLTYTYFGNTYGALPAGQASYVSVLLENTGAASAASLPPSGSLSVTIQPGGDTETAVLLPGSDPYSGLPASTAVFPVSPYSTLGNYIANFSYAGDANYNTLNYSAGFTIGGSPAGLRSSVVASSSATSTSPEAAVQITATVTGQPGQPAPTGYVEFSYQGEFTGPYLELPSSTSNSVTVTASVDSQSLLQGVNQFVVYYSGDNNYRFSETTVTIDNSLSDFSLIPASTIITVPDAGATTEPINISSFNGFAGNVFLSCTGAGGIACSVEPSVNLTSGGTASTALTVNTAGAPAAGTYNVVVTGTDVTGTYIHNIGFQVLTPAITGARQGPVGNLELAVDNATRSTNVSQAHAVFVSGWAADPVDGAPLANVQLYLDGLRLAAPALGLSRPDVATYFNNSSYTDSGFNFSYPASNLYVGTHSILAIATDAAGLATTLGPLTITVTAPPGPPLGNLEVAVDNVTASTTVLKPHQVVISGWIADPVDGSPLSNVKVSIDGVVAGPPILGISRPDVAAYFRNNRYQNSGYTFAYYAANLTVGAHTATVTGTDSSGLSTTFGPLAFQVAAETTPPIGNLESAVDSMTGASALLSTGTLFVGGWAADYHDNSPAKSVQVLIDGTAVGYANLGQPRPDVESYFGNPAWSNTGWTFNYPVSSLSIGSHVAQAIAKDSLGLTTTLGPVSFTIAGVINTVAGDGIVGYSGDSGPATSARLNYPYSLAVDSNENLYVADTDNHVVRKVTPAGIITTFAGNGTLGYSGDGGAATTAQLGYPHGVAPDNNGNLYILDTNYSVVRKVDSGGNITTVAGNGSYGYSGDGQAATTAELYFPFGIAVDGSGDIYIADTYNYVVRKVDTSGVITTIAGNGTSGYSGDGGLATSAEMSAVNAVAVDSAGNVYISDQGNSVIRKVTPAGIISTVAGDGYSGYSGDGGAATSAEISNPFDVAVDNGGNFYIDDSNSSVIRKVNSAGIISTIAGNGLFGYTGDGGPATSADLNFPEGVAVDLSGNLFIADTNNQVVRKVTISESAPNAASSQASLAAAAKP